MKPSTLPHHPTRQRGAATLVVVMILFFIVSLVAAYTSRNMIFEQRTSANQYRSTQALEAAEAGLEWALTQLNYGRIDASCVPSGSTGDSSFRQRYLSVDPATGVISPRLSSTATELTPQCVFDSTTATWSCSCPVDGAPVLSAPTGSAVAPAFQVRFQLASATQPNVVRAQVVGCTRLDAACLNFDGQGQLSEGRVVISSAVALTGGVASVPLASLTARLAVGGTGSDMPVYNSVAGDSGITVQAGSTINRVAARTVPGSIASASFIENDPALALPAAAPYSSADRMFLAVFNVFPESFRKQQAAVELSCNPCTAAQVRTTISTNPGRPLWLPGGLNVDSGGDIGSSAEPVLMIVNGDMAFSSGGATIYGLVYVRPVSPAVNWVTSGTSGQITGAVVAEGGVAGDGTPTLAYSGDTLRRLRANTGTFVRVPGSWRDYQ